MRYLLSVKIEYKGADTWYLRPLNPRKNEKPIKVDLTDEDFKTLLRRIKAKDEKTEPKSVKGRTYQQMINEAKNGSDDTVYVWNTFYPMTKDVAMELALN